MAPLEHVPISATDDDLDHMVVSRSRQRRSMMAIAVVELFAALGSVWAALYAIYLIRASELQT